MPSWHDVVAYERATGHTHPDHDSVLRKDERDKIVKRMLVFGILPLVAIIAV